MRLGRVSMNKFSFLFLIFNLGSIIKVINQRAGRKTLKSRPKLSIWTKPILDSNDDTKTPKKQQPKITGKFFV